MIVEKKKKTLFIKIRENCSETWMLFILDS